MKRIICFALFVITVFSLYSCKKDIIGIPQEEEITGTVCTVYTGDVPDDFFFLVSNSLLIVNSFLHANTHFC